MLAEFGYGVLVVTFVAAFYGISTAVIGYFKKSVALVESARRTMLLTFPLLTVAALTLIWLLINNHFEVQFVYEVTSKSMPTYLKVTAWWGGQAGSLLFWSWLMSAFASLATLRKWDRDQEFLPWVIVAATVTLAFFLALNIFFENPFARLYQTADGNIAAYTFTPTNSTLIVPADGRGLNPLLRHPGMIIHPPMLYLGFVSFVIPFSFAIAALVTGRTDDRWIRLTRRWALWAWLFLSFGLVLGGRWAYDVLGWGGYWGWDPVEISAFMPWLTGTAFLHSVMIQEKRGMLKQWNMVLIILTYALVIFGTFLTRSGVLSSVHAFAQSSIGPAFFLFIGVTFIASISLLIYRWDNLRAEAEMKSLLSREALFLLNNLLFMSILVVCFWGVIFPLISELFTGQKVTVGPPWYEHATSPLMAMLMLLMAIAPLSAWGLREKKIGIKELAMVEGANIAVTILIALAWKTLLVQLGSWTFVLVYLALIHITILMLYFFKHLVTLPGIVAIIITSLVYAFYTHNVIALYGFFLVAIVILVTLQEFWRGTRARQRSQGENFFTALVHLTGKNRRRYGGYLVHISVMMMAIGILGIELFQTQTQGTLQVDQSLNIADYQMVYKSIAQFPGPDARQVTRAVVEVYKNGQPVAELHPRTDYYADAQQNATIPGVRSTLADDFYVILVDWQPASSVGATFKVYVNPLVNWLWIGAIFLLPGIVIAAWPDKDPERMTVRIKRSAHQTSAAD